MDQTDRTLLNIIQSSFPMVEEPFRQIGEETGIPESEVISRIAASKEKNIVRQIGAIFDTRKLGYKTVLVAMRLPSDGLDSGARVINEHPGVSHNYARNGPFNLWFTLAVPPEDSLEDTVEEMAQRAGAESYRLMPTIRFFKIGVNFDMVKREGAAEDYYSPDGYDRNGGQDFKRPAPVSDFEKDAIRELQEDLPLVPRPFEPMADALGITQQQLFDLGSGPPAKGHHAPLQRGPAPQARRIQGQRRWPSGTCPRSARSRSGRLWPSPGG